MNFFEPSNKLKVNEIKYVWSKIHPNSNQIVFIDFSGKQSIFQHRRLYFPIIQQTFNFFYNNKKSHFLTFPKKPKRNN